MNRNLALVALLLLATSCKKEEAAPARSDGIPVKSIVNGMDMLQYQEPSGAFQVDAPSLWKIRETSDLGPQVTFIGPGTAARPNSANISISRYPNPVDKSGDPKTYYNGFALIETLKMVFAYGNRVLGGREVESYAFEQAFRKLHSQKVEYYKRNDFAIVRVPGGFWVIKHSAPAEDYKATFPIFEAVVASFKPGPLPASK